MIELKLLEVGFLLL